MLEHILVGGFVARRELREEETQLWRLVIRDIKPLRVPPPSPPVLPSPEVPKQVSVRPGQPFAAAAALVGRSSSSPVPRRAQDLSVGTRAPGLDDTSWKRLTRGQMKVDARLDLHGYVVQEAFERLHDFMLRAKVRNWRCVEVVTGLGSGQTSGQIRRELPLWLQRGDLRAMVLAVVHPHAANQGSVRILLRTRRR